MPLARVAETEKVLTRAVDSARKGTDVLISRRWSHLILPSRLVSVDHVEKAPPARQQSDQAALVTSGREVLGY